MDRIKIDVAINVPDDIRDDLLKIKAINADYDRCDTPEQLDDAVKRHNHMRSDLLNGAVDILAADESLAEAIKEAIRMYIRSL